MTNEELAIKIQSGERDLMPELWAQVERFVRLLANRRLRRLPSSAVVEFDDLYDSGYLGFLDAVERFDGDRDSSFINFLSMRLKTAFADAAGYRSKKQQLDPLHTAASLDTPLGDDPDSDVLGDLVADEGAQAAFEDVEHRMYLERLHTEMENAMAQLPAPQADLLRRRYYKGETLQSIGDERHITREAVRQLEGHALRYLRRPKIFWRLYRFAYPEAEREIDARTSFYRHSGVSRFNSTGSSSVEDLVIRREGWRQKELDREDREDRETDELLTRIDSDIERVLQVAPWLREKVEALRNQCGEVNSDEPS